MNDPLQPVSGGTSLVRAGDLLFTSAVLAAEHPGGLVDSARPDPGRPFDAEPVKLQTRQIFRSLDALLAAEGTSLDQVVRLDQMCLGRHQATGYIEARNEFLRGDRPVSVLVGVDDLVVPGAVIQLDAVVVAPGSGATRDVARSPDVPYNEGGGYSQAISVGDLVFISGSVATDLKGGAGHPGGPGTGLAPEAIVDPNFWYGSEIGRQTEYVVRQKLAPMLEAGGSSLDDVVHAEVFLTDVAGDWSGFRETWARLFPDGGPAVALYPVETLGAAGARIEICFVGVRSDGATRPEAIGGTGGPGPSDDPWPVATRAGSYLWLSSQWGPSGPRRAEALGLAAGLPHHQQEVKVEVTHLAERVKALCAEQGGGPESVVRARLLLTDIADFAPALDAWHTAFGDHRPALTPAVVPPPFPAVDSRCGLDVVAYLGSSS